MTKIEQIWLESIKKTAESPIDANGFRLNRIDPDSALDIFAGIDAASCVIIAIGTAKRPPSITMDTKAFDYFRQQRNDGSWLMVLRLQRRGLEAVFGRLCQDLLDAAYRVSGDEALISLFRDRLMLWKRLFQHGSNGMLETHQIKGLMAELLSLEWLIKISGRDLAEAVNGWVGPFGADQDFCFTDEVIEVKAIRPGADEISISSLGQLNSQFPIRLVVFEMRAAVRGEHGALSLNDIVARLESLISCDSHAFVIFKERLLEAGFVEQEYYDSICFEPVGKKHYLVGEGFPRLTVETVAEGITKAGYQISVASISNFEETGVL